MQTAERGSILGVPREFVWPLIGTTVLSTLTAVTDSLSLAGLAGKLASGLTDTASTGLISSVKLDNTAVIIAMIAATLVFNAMNTFLREHITAHWDAARRIELVTAYSRADYETQNSYSGAGLSVAVQQIQSASGVIGSVAGLANSVIRTGIYVAVSFTSSWQVSLLCVISGGTLVLSLRALSRRTRRMHLRMAKRNIDLGERIGELALSARELHLLNRWQDGVDHTAVEVNKIRDLRFRSAALAGMVGPIYWTGTMCVGLGVALWAARTGTSVPGLAASGILLIRSLGAAQSAQVMYQQYNDARPYLDRVYIMLRELEAAERIASGELPAGELVLDVEDASLSYGNDVVVPNLSLSFAGRGGVAIIGPSGSGKTTTLHSLSGLIRPAGGVISLDGIPLDDLPSDRLGAMIGLLPQDPKLLRDSLRSNLTRPEVDAADEQLHASLEAVGLTETFEGFNEEFDTQMGRSGEGFSGGEMQRLGLARMVINQPDIWLLDEPTSALDKRNSDRVMSLITEAMEQHLVIVVTHRPELLHHCERIIYMENGKVVDDGPLDEVSDRQPFVRSMLHSAPGSLPSSASAPTSEPVASGSDAAS